MSPVSVAKSRQSLRESVASAVVRIVRSRSESVPALAERLAVVRGTVQRWVDGDGFPNFTTARRIAPLVGVEVRP